MLHALITVIGAGSTRDAAVEEVVRAGGAPIDDGSRLIWAVADGLAGLEALSRRHPGVTIGVEAFEEFGEELMRLVIVGGSASRLSSSPLLDPELFGPAEDAAADAPDPFELRRAGRMVLYRAPAAPQSVDSPLEVSLVMARSLGRFAELAGGWQGDDAPRIETLQAVADLGEAAVALCLGSDHACPAEREHHRAMMLTRAVLHAGRGPLDDGPWHEWLSEILADGACVIRAAYECGHCDDDACRCHEALGVAAIPLLTTCLQALATFTPQSAPSP